ncbi:SDR family oxidoreductase [Actinophytocola sp.]|uniref:SDR family oxidoreductase n=1 Tax=Actinophytocola sp. TaxID=1872138 RepID=UPI002ED2A776
MIVVTGATGNVGQPLVRALVEAGEEVTTVSRRAADVPGARHVTADLTAPQSLTPALDGARALFLLTNGDFHATGDLGKVMHVASEHGVERVVLLSSQGVGTGRHAPGLEGAVTRSGLDWTILRPGGFHSNALWWAPSVRAERTVHAPFGDVALPTIDPADIADVAATALRGTGHSGQTYELTGPVSITPRQQVAAIADALGEPVRFVEQTHAQAKEAMLRFMPEPVVDSTLGALGSPSVEEQRVREDVERLLGRPGRSFADWATRAVAAYK